jgi:hypothetical protein
MDSAQEIALHVDNLAEFGSGFGGLAQHQIGVASRKSYAR